MRYEPHRYPVAVRLSLAILLLAVSMPAVVWGAEPALLKRARSEGLRVGFAQEEPYGYIDEKSRCTGFDVEVTREAAKRLGIKEIICVHLAFEGLIPGLLANRIDIIPVGMGIRPPRCAVVSFTAPYQSRGFAALVLAGNPKNIRSLQDFVDRKDLKLAASVGGTELQTAREKFKIPPERALGYTEQVQAIDAVRTGRADAGIYSTLFINQYLAKQTDGKLERARPFDFGAYSSSGHAFRPTDKDFLKIWDEVLAEMKKDGTIQRLGAPFGWAPDDILGTDAKAEDCCAGFQGNFGCRRP